MSIRTDVKWKKIINDIETDIDVSASQRKYSGATVSSPSLVIKDANQSDATSYVCSAVNSCGIEIGKSSFTVLKIIGGKFE